MEEKHRCVQEKFEEPFYGRAESEKAGGKVKDMDLGSHEVI